MARVPRTGDCLAHGPQAERLAPNCPLHLLVALLVYFAFLNMHAVSVSWMEKQVTPEWLGLWWVQGLLIGITLMVLTIDSRWVRRLRKRIRVPRPVRSGN